jgi:hypothetical protein
MDYFQKDLNGTLIWNPVPGDDDETVLWQGDIIKGYAGGEGKLTWYFKGKEISWYQGNMKMGKPHGQGKYWFADGGIYEGTWKDGLRHGHGKQWYKDGRIYEGNWVSDKREE